MTGIPPSSADVDHAKVAEAYATARLRNAEAARLELVAEKERAGQMENGKLQFYGTVTANTVAEAIQMLTIFHNRKPGHDIEVALTSPGGSVLDGFALYDHLKWLQGHGHRVTVKGSGLVASMGAVLLQAGTERVLTPHAFLMVHEISSQAAGSTAELRDSLTHTEKFQAHALKILTERSNVTVEEIERKWLKFDWFMTADEALEQGFIDRIEF